jgi:peptidoglycan/LPS O-acetylase OafA/YrhL
MNMTGWEPRNLSAAASAHLDVIRAAAAWAVMWGHLRTLFFVDFQHLQGPGWLLGALYFFTGFGHQAVMVFFVLSGFLISATVIKSHISGTWSWRGYAINRSTRLYVVLIPGLLLGSLWDLAGSRLFAATGLYTHPLSDLGPTITSNNLSVANFFGNLFFLQTIICPTFGSNTPLWSLANEFWYYPLFPAALSALLAFFRKDMRVAVPLGVVVACLAAFLVLFGCLFAARTSNAARLGSDPAVGIAFTLFLFGVLQLKLGASAHHYLDVAHRFAGFSYSLYVLHFPLLLFLRAWTVPSQRWQPDGVHLLSGSLIGVAVLVFTWTISLFTEKKTLVARHWVQKRLLIH